ncbi:TAXI family TRAP transporter solute-binding subunit [Stappia sp. BW2]|nr:TAXI family TRAP transporter solute-binding subunit [Stappia sp. BW2]
MPLPRNGRRAELLAKLLETVVATKRLRRHWTGFSPTRTRLSAFLGAGLLLVGWALGSARADEQHFITIGTGGVTGVYYPSGGATCKIVNMTRSEHGVRCSVETTLGSIANIGKIHSGEIDFGYVQSDWQHHAYLGTSAFEKDGPFEELRSIFSLHSEVATIAVREDSPYRKFDDLKGARINIGGKGSGSAASWNSLISRLGWSESDQESLQELKTSELSEALCSGRIDAYFELIGHPAALIEETQARCNIRLIGIDGKAIDALVVEAPYYMPADIPAGLYGLDQPVGSFGVVATFVTSARMPEEIVRTLVKAVFENFESFKRLHPALSRLTEKDLVAYKMPAPLHPGALTYFQEKGLVPATAPAQAN